MSFLCVEGYENISNCVQGGRLVGVNMFMFLIVTGLIKNLVNICHLTKKHEKLPVKIYEHYCDGCYFLFNTT